LACYRPPRDLRSFPTRRSSDLAALIEAPAGDSVARWDFYEYSPQTTNNKMALAGAIATLEWIRRQWKHARVVYVSDSQYLVKGIDRKSTRLNSSHVSISYAVFC